MSREDEMGMVLDECKGLVPYHDLEPANLNTTQGQAKAMYYFLQLNLQWNHTLVEWENENLDFNYRHLFLPKIFIHHARLMRVLGVWNSFVVKDIVDPWDNTDDISWVAESYIKIHGLLSSCLRYHFYDDLSTDENNYYPVDRETFNYTLGNYMKVFNTFLMAHIKLQEPDLLLKLINDESKKFTG